MPDGTMFEPLTADEKVTAADFKAEAQTKRPIIPVPASASLQNFKHPKHGAPTAHGSTGRPAANSSVTPAGLTSPARWHA